MTTTTTYNDKTTGKPAWPTTWDARRTEQQRRRDLVLMRPYTPEECQRLGLFQGTNIGGDTIHRAQRISPLIAYVAQVGTTLLSREWTLNLKGDADPQQNDPRLTRGMETWRRSQIARLARMWADNLTVEADCYMEAAIDDAGRAVVVHHKPQHVRVWLDSRGVEVVKATITFQVDDPDDDSKQVQYVRTLTRDKLSEKIGDKPAKVVDNRLGVVPLGWDQFAPSGVDPYLGKPPWWGIEDGVSVHDSAASILTVIGTKRANTVLFAEGVNPTTGTDAGQSVPGVQGGAVEGGVIVGPVGTDIRPIGHGLEGAQVLVEQAERVHAIVATTCPELLFTEAGANASGTALSHRAASLLAKYAPPDTELRATVGRMLAMAQAMADGLAWSDALDVYEVTAGPMLALDRSAELDALVKALETGLIKPPDAVRKLQDLGYIPRDADSEQYAADALAADITRARGNAEAIGLRQDTPDGGAPAPAGVESVADTALNGAQTGALVTVAEAVGPVTPGYAADVIALAVPTIEPERLARMRRELEASARSGRAVAPPDVVDEPDPGAGV